MDKKTKEFVLKYGVHPDVADSGRIIGNFIDEMEEGLKGREKSLAIRKGVWRSEKGPGALLARCRQGR